MVQAVVSTMMRNRGAEVNLVYGELFFFGGG